MFKCDRCGRAGPSSIRYSWYLHPGARALDVCGECCSQLEGKENGKNKKLPDIDFLCGMEQCKKEFLPVVKKPHRMLRIEEVIEKV